MKTTNNLCILTQNGTTCPIDTKRPMTLTLKANETADLWAFIQEGAWTVHVSLNEPGAQVRLHAIYLADQKNQLNLTFDVRHNAPETTSYQLVKGIATDDSKTAFNGAIYIAPNAQKTSGAQTHRAVLLSDKALVSAVPRLEIYADDVKCAHGSAIGALDKTHLFYLQARGIPAPEAYKMLIRSFLAEAAAPDFNSLIDEWMEKHV